MLGVTSLDHLAVVILGSEWPVCLRCSLPACLAFHVWYDILMEVCIVVACAAFGRVAMFALIDGYEVASVLTDDFKNLHRLVFRVRG